MELDNGSTNALPSHPSSDENSQLGRKESIYSYSYLGNEDTNILSSSRGISFQLTQQLAKYGAKVYLAARSEAAAKEAIERIERETPELQRLRDKNQIQFLTLIY
ncbi:hypothetical protein BDN71DRAFT_1435804 [Pleurotus eryngii]|uniref:Uncharacterized protein n=1 Tax=Pleurotus eryngii TaxID=5323 RepID=A0A9P6D2S6_PLEER|nr:hypothetical protein BDN71DRAFT_1435804 [Pleurotus eryngii]